MQWAGSSRSSEAGAAVSIEQLGSDGSWQRTRLEPGLDDGFAFAGDLVGPFAAELGDRFDERRAPVDETNTVVGGIAIREMALGD